MFAPREMSGDILVSGIMSMGWAEKNTSEFWWRLRNSDHFIGYTHTTHLKYTQSREGRIAVNLTERESVRHHQICTREEAAGRGLLR